MERRDRFDSSQACAGTTMCERSRSIRYLPLSIVFPTLIFVMAHPVAAAPSLALPHTDYPQGARIAVYLPSNTEADERFHRVHRSSFEHLHRIDGMGWLQGAVWHYAIGRGTARQTHLVTFGYGINVFNNTQQARKAAQDVRLRVKAFRLAHVAAQRYTAADTHVSLDFVFFVYGSVEVETYYEHTGAAPAGLKHRLSAIFNRQNSDLVQLARKLNTALHTHPTPTPVPTATPSPSPTAILTP